MSRELWLMRVLTIEMLWSWWCNFLSLMHDFQRKCWLLWNFCGITHNFVNVVSFRSISVCWILVVPLKVKVLMWPTCLSWKMVLLTCRWDKINAFLFMKILSCNLRNCGLKVIILNCCMFEKMNYRLETNKYLSWNILAELLRSFAWLCMAVQ